MEGQVTLAGVMNTEIEDLWPLLTPMINNTLKYSDDKYSLASIKQALLDREMQLWIALQNGNILSYTITQIVTYPTHKRICVVLVGGIEMFKWLHFINELKEWAKYHGCTVMEGYGRPGWEKELREYGFEKIHTVYKSLI